MTNLIFGIVLGALVSSACWWAYVRSVKGVISDLTDARDDAKAAVKKL